MSHSKRYNELVKTAPREKISIKEAITFIQEKSTEKFDPTVELHVRLGIDAKQSDQSVRGSVSLPAGTGKTVKIAAVVEDAQIDAAKAAGADRVGSTDLIDEIKAGKIDFDVLVATPEMMPKLGPVAKILGPKGLMPNPKTETVGPDVDKMIKSIKQGKANFKNDEQGIIHLPVGKKSFKAEDLIKNIEVALEAIKSLKPTSIKGTYLKKISLSSSMGPGITVSAK